MWSDHGIRVGELDAAQATDTFQSEVLRHFDSAQVTGYGLLFLDHAIENTS